MMTKADKTVFSFAGCRVEASLFKPENGVGEAHFMFHPELCTGKDLFPPFLEQLEAILNAFCEVEALELFRGMCFQFGRLFIKDFKENFIVAEQFLSNIPCTVSIIGQPPLDGSDVSLWLYASTGGVSHNGYEHIWTAGAHSEQTTPFQQAEAIIGGYAGQLVQRGCTLADNCMKTWFFIDNVDTNYASFVLGRKEVFDRNNLTADTHYISSTGIEGVSHSTVSMDAYAVKGIVPQQVTFLRGLSHLSSTIVYGVTFERGVAIQYGDRRHILISGTASIDKMGNVVHIGNIHSQTLRTFDNIEVILKEAGASLKDVVLCIVYLRNISDFQVVDGLVRGTLPDIPTIVVLAPVCRPQWLVEIECIALTSEGDSRFKSL